jgi:type II secretory pathway predicted ATPase ExeA
MKSIVEQYNECRRREMAESDPPSVPVLGRLSRSPVKRLARSYRDCSPAAMLVSRSRFAAGYVLDRFLATIDGGTMVILVEQSFAEPVAFMKHIVSAVGFGSRATSLPHLEHALGLFLHHQKTRSLRTVVAIRDIDAQGAGVLGSIHDLIELESANEFGLMVVATCTANDPLEPLDPMLRAISSRAAVRVVLTPFVLSETREFIRERFERRVSNGAGGATEALRFEMYATQLIHELSSGAPETVDLLCRKAIAVAARSDEKAISVSDVKVAARLLGLLPASSGVQDASPVAANGLRGDSFGHLIVKVRGMPEQTVALNGSHVLIGRDRLCDICIEDNQVSRLHGLIARSKEGVYYLDLGSTNGSAVNGAMAHRLALENNDVIAVGDVRIIYSLKGAIEDDDIDLDATDTFEIPDFSERSPADYAGNGKRAPRRR